MNHSILSWFDVSIDFQTSHLVFPRIILILLAVTLLMMLVSNYRTLGARLRNAGLNTAALAGTDWFRLGSTFVLLVGYFVSMYYVGDLYPNEGKGFLFCSIPFMLMLSLVYMHQRTPKAVIGVLINAIVTPLAVWYLLGDVFGVSLP
ncbi:tripartite tricarboxylate transporter TctB family protein [Pokkaliibacter sp. MBI-7]|uniref:tripartite tricarboxylate transporter TctB family protein n=1 Tax=Pokkaliibacter sp. MBI-7 TaxID=3040600 RepID=UPI00244985BD|nr:tripartite tricarboxylate transporter TctB family protein [Pokkaliibacter sp. MBI-7]MDH2433447.1 tripartite tricarboxylate transporter TctB family protein [Pokkaliibacter sp. MBI-7]